MRRPKTAILIQLPSGWHYRLPNGQAECLVASDAEPGEIVDAVHATPLLRDCRRVAVLLDSRSVFFNSFDAADMGKSPRRQVLLFRVEADLPFDAEDLIAAFQTGDKSVEAVAANKHGLLELVGGLSRQGHIVECLAPASPLSIQTLVERRQLPETCSVTLLVGDDVETFLLEQGRVVRWKISPRGTNVELNQRMCNRVDDRQVPEIVVGDSSQLADWALEHDFERLAFASHELCYRKAWRVLNGHERSWFDLCDDPEVDTCIRGKPGEHLRKLGATICACLLIIAAGLAWRAYRLQLVAERIREQTHHVFAATYPDARVPSAVVARLRSEHTKLVASRSSEGQSVPLPTAALPILDRLLAALPQEILFSINEIRIEDGEVYLDLELQTHADAGVIAKAFQEQGLVFYPPNTQNEGESVRAIMRGSREDGQSDIDVDSRSSQGGRS